MAVGTYPYPRMGGTPRKAPSSRYTLHLWRHKPRCRVMRALSQMAQSALPDPEPPCNVIPSKSQDIEQIRE